MRSQVRKLEDNIRLGEALLKKVMNRASNRRKVLVCVVFPMGDWDERNGIWKRCDFDGVSKRMLVEADLALRDKLLLVGHRYRDLRDGVCLHGDQMSRHEHRGTTQRSSARLVPWRSI